MEAGRPCKALISIYIRSFSLGRIQDFFADTQVLGGNLQKLVRFYEIQGLLQA